jgi:hypothetical protein
MTPFSELRFGEHPRAFQFDKSNLQGYNSCPLMLGSIFNTYGRPAAQEYRLRVEQ